MPKELVGSSDVSELPEARFLLLLVRMFTHVRLLLALANSPGLAVRRTVAALLTDSLRFARTSRSGIPGRPTPPS
jgi:hypothetical protein